MEIKKTSNLRRRNRPNGRRNNFSRNNYQNNSVNRPKGSVSKILEKYLNLAQDAVSNGDRIRAEGFFQHAEHYQRVINTSNDNDNAKKINISEKSSVNSDSSASPDKNLLSRTERATNAKSERLNNKSQELEKKSSKEQNTKNNYTTDGVEALKAFSGALSDKNSVEN